MNPQDATVANADGPNSRRNGSAGVRMCLRCSCALVSQRSDAVFCGDRCRIKYWEERHPRQAVLCLDPAPVPVRSLDDPPKDQHGRLKRSCALILGRLQRGPATGLELATCGGGLRFGARLEELRKRGHRILSEPKDEANGVWIYRLEQEG